MGAGSNACAHWRMRPYGALRQNETSPMVYVVQKNRKKQSLNLVKYGKVYFFKLAIRNQRQVSANRSIIAEKAYKSKLSKPGSLYPPPERFLLFSVVNFAVLYMITNE